MIQFLTQNSAVLLSKYITILAFILAPQFIYAQTDIRLEKATLYSHVKEADLLKTKIVLLEEIYKRTGVNLSEVKQPSSKNSGNIILTLEGDVKSLSTLYKDGLSALPEISQEGYKVWADPKTNTLIIMGKDARGLLYGVGHFLKKATLTKGKIQFNTSNNIASSPQYKLRGHQLGYRPKTNSYDAFTVEQFDQYIRELALFGANSIEILPPRTDDKPTSKHMKVPAMKMVKEQARISQEYGLDVWMWYPNLEKHYADPAQIKLALAEREEVFKNVPKIDAIFSPGGDPGDLEPDQLFAWMEQVSVVLHKYHPNAKIWLSPQSFRPEKSWFDAFFKLVNEKPKWFGGVVFGPWVRIPIEEIRKTVDPSIPIRNYPDISHSIQCQYQVPDWDPAWALAMGREAINPRPIDYKLIHNDVAPYCIGSISYSEGTNDDLNKFIWSDQDWNANTKVEETIRDYVRFFFGSEYTEAGLHAFMSLENNHKGSAINKTSVQQTLWQWQALEKKATTELLKNPRFLMGLLRAYTDAYTQERLIYETYLERQARELLLKTHQTGNTQHVQEARVLLQKGWKVPIREDLKSRCLAIGDDLFELIGAQLSMQKHGAESGRGNFLDFLQLPISDSPWLLHQLENMEQNSGVALKQLLYKILHRTDPGEGGFYDHFGNKDSWKRVIQDENWEKDPGALKSVRTGYGMNINDEKWFINIPEVAVKVPVTPKAWGSQVEALYGVPLRIFYDNLDPKARYRMKIAYTGRFKPHVRLKSDDGTLIHDYIRIGENPMHEVELPHHTTKDGYIQFEWNCLESERGVQVSEIWLEKINELQN